MAVILRYFRRPLAYSTTRCLSNHFGLKPPDAFASELGPTCLFEKFAGLDGDHVFGGPSDPYPVSPFQKISSGPYHPLSGHRGGVSYLDLVFGKLT